LHTPRWLALLALGIPAVLAVPASAAQVAETTWPQYQGGAARTGVTPAGTPEPPYLVSWRAATGIGDPSQVLGVPTPVLTGDLAIVAGRESVDAVDTASGSAAWSVPRALGPSAPVAVDGGTFLFTEGGGDDASTSSATSPTPTTGTTAPSASRGASPSASVSPAPPSDVSTLVALDVASQERSWTVALTDVSHTGVLVAGHEALVGTDDGTLTAVDRRGETVWSQDVGDHVLAPMAAFGDLVFASVRPESQSVTAALVALHTDDGSLAWRYEPSGPVLDLGGPAVGVNDAGQPVIYVAGVDGSVRAIDATDGSQAWAAPLYSPTLGAPPAVSGTAVVVTDQSGTVYALDPATGAERWRFATNLQTISPPMLTGSAAIQPASDGTVSTIDLATGHETWHGAIADSAVLGLAAAPGRVVASVTGTSPGLVALANDPAGVTEDVVSPTVSDPAGLLRNWAGAAIPLTVLFFVVGRALAARMGPVAFAGGEDEETPVDPWELGEDDA
jgi:outer membrane protein assembly factor BamB